MDSNAILANRRRELERIKFAIQLQDVFVLATFVFCTFIIWKWVMEPIYAVAEKYRRRSGSVDVNVLGVHIEILNVAIVVDEVLPYYIAAQTYGGFCIITESSGDPNIHAASLIMMVLALASLRFALRDFLYHSDLLINGEFLHACIWWILGCLLLVGNGILIMLLGYSDPNPDILPYGWILVHVGFLQIIAFACAIPIGIIQGEIWHTRMVHMK